MEQRIGNDVFETTADVIDVTSNRRPDTDWVCTDIAGHEHRWYTNEQPATSYDPSAKYETPTLVWVKLGERYWDGDDEPYAYGEWRCKQCSESILPRYTSDTHRQFIQGLRTYRINGEPVSLEEFERRWEAAARG